MNSTETDRDAALVHRIAGIFATMQVEVPRPDTDLFGKGLLDSLAFVDLVARLEQEFGITCTVEDLETDNFRTIERIADFVGRTVPVLSTKRWSKTGSHLKVNKA
jgi:acyl carrier protein